MMISPPFLNCFFNISSFKIFICRLLAQISKLFIRCEA